MTKRAASPAAVTTPEAAPAATAEHGAGERAPPDLLLEAAATVAGEGQESAEALRAMQGRLEAERGAVLARIDELDAFADASFLEVTDDTLDANDAAIVRMRRRAQRVERLAERIAARLRDAEAREAEAARQARYDAAVEAANMAEAWVREDYATHAAAIGEGLARLADAEAAIRAANADLPIEAPRLQLEKFRALAGTPDSITHEPGRYYVDNAGSELRPSDDEPLHQDERGQFFVGRQPVYARERQVAVRTPGRQTVMPRPLAVAVHLPGVAYADVDFWPRRSKLWGA